MSPERLDVRSAARAVVAARRSGQPIASVKSLAGPGAGETLLVYADGRTLGSLGQESLDGVARALGLACLASGEPALQNVDPQVRLFCEPHLAAARLVIVGAGHIAVPLAEICCTLGFQVIVLDDREEFATETRFPEPARVLRMDFTHPFDDIQLDGNTYVVLVTRAHKYDFDCLRDLLGRSQLPRYIGMIGSRRRVRAAFHALLADGVPSPRVALVHAPLGLDIGAETPAEIAVSIAAELIRQRSGSGTGKPLSEEERVLDRFFALDYGADIVGAHRSKENDGRS
jgi:xanthine dehydrogenase accessory factor